MYCHIQLITAQRVRTFQPRVPLLRMPNEDDITPRVCVAPSVELALASAPDYYGELEDAEYSREEALDFLYKHPTKLVLGLPLRVYWFDKPAYAPTKEQVWDVDETSEHWYLEPIQASRISYVFVFLRDGEVFVDDMDEAITYQLARDVWDDGDEEFIHYIYGGVKE